MTRTPCSGPLHGGAGFDISRILEVALIGGKYYFCLNRSITLIALIDIPVNPNAVH
jgi:hypothetical protein